MRKRDVWAYENTRMTLDAFAHGGGFAGDVGQGRYRVDGGGDGGRIRCPVPPSVNVVPGEMGDMMPIPGA